MINVLQVIAGVLLIVVGLTTFIGFGKRPAYEKWAGRGPIAIIDCAFGSFLVMMGAFSHSTFVFYLVACLMILAFFSGILLLCRFLVREREGEQGRS